MIQESGVVRKIYQVRRAIFGLTLELPAISQLAQPGQFLHLLVPGTPGVLLRRPFSIAGVNGTQVELLIRIIGSGTEAISKFPIGFTGDVIGPLGRGFNIDAVQHAFLVGGGIGAAPLLFLQDELERRKVETHFFLGARAHLEFPLPDDLVRKSSIHAATDDGSFGAAGFVSIVFEKWLEANEHAHSHVYSCGPIAMMQEVSRICEKHGLPHQVSLENRMACGIGVCQGCAMPMKNGFKLVCKEGPVSDAQDVNWDVLRDF